MLSIIISNIWYYIIHIDVVNTLASCSQRGTTTGPLLLFPQACKDYNRRIRYFVFYPLSARRPNRGTDLAYGAAGCTRTRGTPAAIPPGTPPSSAVAAVRILFVFRHCR